MKLALIDADILTYSIAFSVQVPLYWCNGRLFVTHGDAKKHSAIYDKRVIIRHNVGGEGMIRRNLNQKISSILKDLGTTNFKMFITASGIEKNFRYGVSTIQKYKANRVDSVRPVKYHQVREILLNDYKGIEVIGEEADDMLGIEQIKAYEKEGDFESTIICTIDKDLRTIPGYHYHLEKRTVDFVPQLNANLSFFVQMIQGDTTDNIPGLYRLLVLDGRKEEADKLARSRYLSKYKKELGKCVERTYLNKILEIYGQYGYTEKEVKEIGTLLWIRRHENEDFWTYAKENFYTE